MAAESTFAYRARDQAGDVVIGQMTATTADEVGTRLRAEGKVVVEIDDKPLRADTQLDAQQIRRNEAAKRVRREDVIAFCQQLAVMLETGVPLTEALDAFCRQVTRKEFRDVLEVLREDIYGGETFSFAMAKWPRVFPRMMTSLMKASEASGTMAMMLGRVGDYLGKERRTLKQIKGALAYPAFMICIALVLSVFLMVVILPRFATIYEGKSAALPFMTKALLAFSDVMMTHWMYYVPVLVGTFLGWILFIRHPAGRSTLDYLRLKVPVVRTMYQQLYLTRASRTMATLIIAGVNLLDIIEICRGVTQNVHFNKLWDDMERGIRDGRQMSDSVNNSPFIPPNVASMIASGERSGKLGVVMGKIAEFSEEELDSAVKQVTSFIEPVMVVGMGILVGGVAMALLLPIFKMGSVMAGN